MQQSITMAQMVCATFPVIMPTAILHSFSFYKPPTDIIPRLAGAALKEQEALFTLN